MKVHELIELLEEVDRPDAEVWLAHQEHYPLQFTVHGVFDPSESVPMRCDTHDALDCPECEPPEIPDVIYIVEGGHPEDPETWTKRPYGPAEAWDAARR